MEKDSKRTDCILKDSALKVYRPFVFTIIVDNMPSRSS